MLDELEKAIARGDKHAIDQHGLNVVAWVKDTMPKLEKQFHWLDPENMSHAQYEKRFAQWEALLREYERACRLLAQAEGVL